MSMRAVTTVAAMALAASCGVWAQGIMGDVLSGKLVNPETGAFAWYDLTDAATGKTMFVRQAVVAEEKVDKKKGYWIETEIIPQVGFPSVYKMLVTGPASDPRNVHRIVAREGGGAPAEVPLAKSEDVPKPAEPEKTSLGMESIETLQGSIEAEHFSWSADGRKTEVWVNDKIPPMGIVKMVSPEGEMVLRKWGKGGQDGQSALERMADAPPAQEDVQVRVETKAKKNFKGKSGNEKE